MSSWKAWKPPGSTLGSGAIEVALRDIENRLARVDHALFRADWALNTGKSRTGPLGIRLARAALLSHPDLLTWCRDTRRRAAPPLLRRRLELVEQQAIDAQLEQYPPIARINARIERRILAFRPRWRGHRVSQAEIWDLVSREPGPELRKAGYYANQPLFLALEPQVRSLVAARNDRARELGFSNYPEARLNLEGLSVPILTRLMDPLVSLARRVSRASHDRSGIDSWYPWDWMFAHHQENRAKRGFSGRECLAAVRRGLHRWGFGLNDLSFRFLQFDTPTAGLALVGDTPRDVGVIANPRDGIIYYSILFHEMGHGIHARSVRGASPMLRRIGFPGFTESIGSLFEDLTADPAWLRTRPGVSREEAARIRTRSYESLALRMAELVGEVYTELRLYAQPEADLLDERRQFIKRRLGYDDHEPISWVDPYYLSPGFYRQSYLLATCFGEQVLSKRGRERGGELWPDRHFGPWLKETWLRPGQRDEWVPKVHQLTGKPLGSEDFVAAVRRET